MDIITETLVDTGSQITAIRKDFYLFISPLLLDQQTIKLTGHGSKSLTPLGSYNAGIQIDRTLKIEYQRL